MFSFSNKLNIFAWTNFSFRLLVNFGLLAVIGALMGQSGLQTWLLLITLVATVSTLDALLGQYFLRAYVDRERLEASYGAGWILSLQFKIYFIVSVFSFFGAYYFLRKLGVVEAGIVATLVAFMAFYRRYDAQVKAVFDQEKIQLWEAISSIVLFILSLLALFITNSVFVLIIIYLGCLIVFFLVKKHIVAGSFPEGRRINLCKGEGVFPSQLLRTIVISFGGALSINLSLLLVSDVLNTDNSSILLLTYRFAMLVCEFSSVPVVARIPEISRAILARDKLSSIVLFEKNVLLAIAMLIIGFLVLFGFANSLFFYIGLEFHLYQGFIAVVISLGWFAERVNTFISQYLLSSKVFEHVRLYFIYIVVIIVGVVISRLLKWEMPFIFSQLFGNLLIVPFIIKKYLSVRAGYKELG